MDRTARIPRWVAPSVLAWLALLGSPTAAQTGAAPGEQAASCEDSSGEAAPGEAARAGAATGGATEAGAVEDDAVADEDPRAIVIFNLRLQYADLGDGNSGEFLVLRRDAAIHRPRRPNVRLATLRWDLPAGRVHIQGEDSVGIGDLYFQALNFRDISRRFSVGSGLAFQLPTATDGPLGAGKWQVAPSVFPLRTMPAKKAIFFTRMQNFASFGGQDDRRDINYLLITPTLVKMFDRRNGMLLDTEAIVDWERDGELSWKSGLLFATTFGGRRAAWIKAEVPWGEHRRGEWTVRMSIAWRRPPR